MALRFWHVGAARKKGDREARAEAQRRLHHKSFRPTRYCPCTLPRLAAMVHTGLQAGLPPAKIRAVIPDRQKTPIAGTDL